MPRTKANPEELLILELRITPPDQQPITEWPHVNDVNFKMLIAAKEGGEGTDKQLHYHLYAECLRSRTWLEKWIYTTARANKLEAKGNKVFFSRKPHENSIGYVVKEGNLVVRHGTTDQFITEWMTKSDQYRKDKEASRKKKQRIEKSFTQRVRDILVDHLVYNPDDRTEEACLELIIKCYQEAEKIYPSRATVELLIVTSLAQYRPYMVRSFYLKNFEPR